MGPGPVWTGTENLASTGILSLDRPAGSESQYRLSAPSPQITNHIIFSFLLALVLNFLLYISKHTSVIFPAREMKKKFN